MTCKITKCFNFSVPQNFADCFRRIRTVFIAIAVMQASGPFTISAAHAAPKPAANAEVASPGPRRHLARIVFAGLAGAILGLSTLSFYGRPQDRLSNIAVGFAIGVIGGTVYTTYKAASEPKDFYSLREERPELWAMGEDTRHMRTFAPGPRFTFEF